MGIPGSANLLLMGGGAQAYQIEQSLRFNSADSHYLVKTFSSSPTSSTTQTFSWWAKLLNTDGANQFPGIYGRNASIECGFSYRNTGDATNPSGFRIENGSNQIRTSAKYRDFSAWMHCVMVFDTSNATSADRIRLYVNGERVTNFAAESQPGSGATVALLSTYTNGNYIGSYIGGGNYGDFYLAEFHGIDGQALTADSFGEFDDNGVWRPIAYSGSYGTNGFYLKFDPSATNGIGHDHSGNGNNWTANSFTTSGTGTDVMSDTPTNNFCTLNPLFQASNLTNGNLQYNRVSPNIPDVGTIALPANQGKWYWEITLNSNNGDDSEWVFGVVKTTLPKGTVSGSYAAYQHASQTRRAYGTLDNGPSWSLAIGDVLGIGIDMTNGDFRLYKNGTLISNWTGSVDTDFDHYPFINGYWSGDNATMNFGQRAFEYTPPTDHVALCTANLPAPDIADGSEYFNTLLWSGNGVSGRAITGVGFQPDFLWIKRRNASVSHYLQNSIAGATYYMFSDDTVQERNLDDSVDSFDTDGFTLGNDGGTNASGGTYVGWNWKANGSGSSNTAGSINSTVSANPSAGFSIVSYTGTGANATVGHGLGVAPQFFFGRNRDDTSGLLDWIVYHESIGNTGRLKLNTTGSTSTSSTFFQNTSPSSTVISIGTSNDINKLNDDYIMYCFAEVEGYSKFGSYTGNGNLDGVFNYCGFKPAWLLVKRTNTAANWHLVDSVRSPYNLVNTILLPDLSDQESTYSNGGVDFTSNGFKIRSTGQAFNNSGDSYIFVAFASHPFGGSGVSPATAR